MNSFILFTSKYSKVLAFQKQQVYDLLLYKVIAIKHYLTKKGANSWRFKVTNNIKSIRLGVFQQLYFIVHI